MDQSLLLSGSIVALLLGAAVGSFLNVIVLRTATQRSFVSGRSRCSHCGRTLSWYELIPIGSFVLLGGRCRTCKKTLSVQYLLMEVLTATSFILVWMRFGWSLMTVAGWFVTSALLLIALYDARWSLIPDSFTITLAVATVSALILGPIDIVGSLLGIAVGAGIFWLQYAVSRGAWVGSGDIFLGGVLGVLLGWRLMLGALGVSYILGALTTIPILLRGGGKKMIPFGPFLALGSWIVWLWGANLWQWYLLHL